MVTALSPQGSIFGVGTGHLLTIRDGQISRISHRR
jgi:hypothetical protein